MTDYPHTTTDRAGWPVEAWAREAGLSRATVYKILPELKTCKVGAKRLILESPREYLSRKAAEQSGEAA